MPIPPNPVDTSMLLPEPSPADWAAPNSLAAVLTVRAALAVLPVVKSLDSMLIGIVAIRKGVLKLLSIDSDDVEVVEDVDDVVSVAEDVRAAKLWGDARLCRICGTPEISSGPDDIRVSTSVPADAPAVWAVAAVCAASPPGLVVCGGVLNGVTCAAVADVLA